MAEKKAGGIVHFVREWEQKRMLLRMLEVLDETGAWVEYYDNKKPFNCRCRPWESAINIDAIRKLTESFQ